MIRLIIKGDVFDARAALDSRGMGTMMALGDREHKDGIVAEVWDEHEHAVQKWFCEGLWRAPYPPGTLLHYTYIKE